MQEVNRLVESARQSTKTGVLDALGEPDIRRSRQEANRVSDAVNELGSVFLNAPELDEAWGYRDPYRTRIYYFGFAKGRVAHSWIQRVE